MMECLLVPVVLRSIRRLGDVSVRAELGPEGDFFAEPFDLGSDRILHMERQGRGATSEPFEPFHAGSPARFSIWLPVRE